MQQREEFIREYVQRTMPVTTLCALYGISTQTGHKLIRRWKQTRSVAELSRRPKRQPRATPARLVRLIVSQKKQFPLWGPVPIRKRLQTLWPEEPWPSASTVGAILKRQGLVRRRRRRHRAAPRTAPFAKVREPNDVWCVDFKGDFVMGNGKRCYPLTVMDAASRCLLACVAFHEPSLANVVPVFVELFKKYGLPTAIRSDNGEPFASVSAAAGLTQLSAWWARLRIRLERIDPGEPQQNGRHERMHGTLKQAACTPPRRSLGWQQRAFDRFLDHYNYVRPHQSLDLCTPGSLYRPSTRPYPEHLPNPDYPIADVHCVRSDGTIRVGSRRQFISTALAGELVGLYPVNDRYLEVHYADLLLGLIDLRNNNTNPRSNLVRPRPPHAGRRPTKVSAMCPV